jgi:DNA-binding NtrC family response regulator
MEQSAHAPEPGTGAALQTPGAQTAGHDSTHPTESHELHVLLVDDNPTFVRSTARALRALLSPIEVTTGTSIHEAISAVERRPPDVVVTDWWLADGYALQLLKRLPTIIPDRPLIVITADRSPAVQEQACKAGAMLVYKPFEPDVLVRAICAVLAERPSAWRA